MISQTTYRLLVTLGVIGTAVSVVAAIAFWPVGWPEWLLLMVFGMYVPLVVILTVKRQMMVADEPAWPWWKAGVFTVALIVLVAVGVQVISRWL